MYKYSLVDKFYPVRCVYKYLYPRYNTCTQPTILTFDQKRVVTAFPQLHHSVEEVGHVGRASRSLGQEIEVTFQNGPVILLLDVS